MLGQPDPIVPVRCAGAFTKDSPAKMERELGLRCGEDVVRVLFAMVNKGLARRHELDEESDFDGLFVLD
jgi:hypothetical protein